jgi:hypothetical protein
MTIDIAGVDITGYSDTSELDLVPAASMRFYRNTLNFEIGRASCRERV